MTNDGIKGTTAYGHMLGTSMICCLLEVMFFILPICIVKPIFLPLVTAITVILIGVALIGMGVASHDTVTIDINANGSGLRSHTFGSSGWCRAHDVEVPETHVSARTRAAAGETSDRGAATVDLLYDDHDE